MGMEMYQAMTGGQQLTCRVQNLRDIDRLCGPKNWRAAKLATRGSYLPSYLSRCAKKSLPMTDSPSWRCYGKMGISMSNGIKHNDE